MNCHYGLYHASHSRAVTWLGYIWKSCIFHTQPKVDDEMTLRRRTAEAH